MLEGPNSVLRLSQTLYFLSLLCCRLAQILDGLGKGVASDSFEIGWQIDWLVPQLGAHIQLLAIFNIYLTTFYIYLSLHQFILIYVIYSKVVCLC
jgi:hypothetical protein